MLDEYIAQSEARGYVTSEKYYESLIDREKENISKLQNEKNALLASLNEAVSSGAITRGSEAFYDMCSQINDVTLAIEEGNTAILEYSNSIRDIQWSVFDMIQEKISQVTEEADFLIDLMSNEKLYDDRGQLTDKGMATMGLHGQNYNTYMAQADKYAEEILNIDKQIADDPYNQDLIKRRQELLELQRENILSAEDEKQAIIDMVREGIELELDSLQELIDKYSEALESEKDLYDYQKKISSQTKNIASLEKQLAAYAGDTSEEAKQKIQQIKVSLEEANNELEDTMYDRYISDQQKLLDELYLEYEDVLNQRLDNTDALIEDMIYNINNNASAIRDTLLESSDSVGYTLSDNLSDIWDTSTTDITNVLTTYGQSLQDSILSSTTTLNSVLVAINTNTQSMISQLNSLANTKIQSVKETNALNETKNPTSSAINNTKITKDDMVISVKLSPNKAKSTNTSTSKSKSNDSNIFDYKKDYYPKDKLNTDTSVVDKLKSLDYDSSFSARKEYYNDMGLSGTYTGSVEQNEQMLSWMKKKGYRVGRYNLPNDEFAWTQEGRREEVIIRPSDGAILTPLAKGDSVLNANASSNIWDMATSPVDFIRDNLRVEGSSAPLYQGGQTKYVQNLENVTFSLPNVRNYSELLGEMQRDKNFERLILSMTIDQVAGKSSLAKGKSIR